MTSRLQVDPVWPDIRSHALATSERCPRSEFYSSEALFAGDRFGMLTLRIFITASGFKGPVSLPESRPQVIIPAYNEATNIAKCLKRLADAAGSPVNQNLSA